MEQHEHYLRKVSGRRREDAFGSLYFAEYENDPDLDAA